jgi:hypothetical protein
MRTDTRIAYQFGELSDAAKGKALEWWQGLDRFDDLSHEADWFASLDGWGIEHSGKGGPWWTTPYDRGGADMMIAPNDGDHIAPMDGITVLEECEAWRLARALGVKFQWRHNQHSRSMVHGRIVPLLPAENDGVLIANLHFVGTTYGEEDALIESGAYSALGDWDTERDDPDATREWADNHPGGAWSIAWDAAEFLQTTIDAAWREQVEWLDSEENAVQELTEREYEFTVDGRPL